jgi:non-specific serine/threonine protein kinase/serine/threonine-protein kinase
MAEEKNNNQAGEEEYIPTASFADSEKGPGGKIGPYKLLSILGEGGFGIVYLAEQQKPVKRRVALKVIKPGMDSKQVIARFEAEEQALALLDHPNVAQVYEAGMTKAGRPYFAMECVKGVPITEYCDREKLSIEERLGLFLQVCEGLQHAHQKGVIHRDIKPSNILVFVQEKKAVPKIIDFGVAKAISQPLTERTLYTEQGQFVGTPEYMSPEQAESSKDIDIRTDIYSLGALLYELLTGVLPFAAETLREGGFENIKHIIREEEPKTPSTRLSRLSKEESTKLAQCRRMDIGMLRRKLGGDLDWITLKAMEKDRTRRYASATELAVDIKHHLNNEPVLASPPSTVYRMKKFVRRNRALVTGIAAVLVVLVGGIVASTIFAVGQARARAEAQTVADFLKNDVLSSADPFKAKGQEVTVRYVLDSASKSIEGKFEGKPLVEASIRQTLGTTYSNLGKYEAAEPHLEQAHKIHREHLGEEHPDTVTSMFKLGDLYLKQYRGDEAEPLLVKALEIRRRVLGEEHPDTLVSMFGLAWVYLSQGRYDEAEALYVKALEGQRRVLGDEHPDTLRSMFGLASVNQRLEEEESTLVKVLESQRRVLGEEHPDTLRTIGLLGELYERLGRYDEAEAMLIKAVETYRRILGDEHSITLDTIGDLILFYIRQQRYDEAEPLNIKYLEIQRRLLGEEHWLTMSALNTHADISGDQDQWDKAEPLYVKVLEFRHQALGEEPEDTLGSMGRLADIYVSQGRYEDAEGLLVEILEIRRRVLGEQHELTLGDMSDLIALYEAWGKKEKAEEWRAKLPSK